MSRTMLLLRLVGDLPPAEELATLLSPTFPPGSASYIQRGKPLRALGGKSQDVDVWTLKLIERQEWTNSTPNEHALQRALEELRNILPQLTRFDRQRFRAELYISTIREEEQGDLFLPAELMAVAGTGQLGLLISTLVMWPSDDDDSDTT